MAIYHLLLQSGTLLDSAQAIHARRDVAFAGGRVAAVAERIDPTSAREVINSEGYTVTPGLIDLHVHVFPGVSYYGIEATTSVSALTCAIHPLGYRKGLIEHDTLTARTHRWQICPQNRYHHWRHGGYRSCHRC